MSFARLAWVCTVGSFSMACGLRTVPIFEGSTDTFDGTDSESATDPHDTDDEDTGPIEPPVEGRAGSCTNPIELPTTDSSVVGVLRGPGLYGDGLCGPDDGLEDVYHLKLPTASDVTITFDPDETEFPPTLRVLEWSCPVTEGVTRVCTNDVFDGSVSDPRHFIANGTRDYYIYVESQDGNGGDYAFSITLGQPPLEQCHVHPETIFQSSGSVFQWENDFGAGSGRVDSLCQGAGQENMFAVSASYPGNMYVDVVGSNGFRPLASVREGCSALTELDCTSEAILGTPGFASLQFFIPGPGTYYVVADTLGLTGGTYNLSVAFD